MTIEEKAIAYDEANYNNYKSFNELIERLESVKSAIKEHNYGIAMDILCKPYPGFQVITSTEVKESDERIRKRIIQALHGDVLKMSEIKEATDWLEKQGEQKLPIEKLPSETKTIGKSLGFTTQEDCDRYNQMVSDLIMSDDDKGEQKPADKAEPKFKVGNWIANGIETVQITGYDIDYGYQVNYKGNLQHRDTDIIEKEYHLWAIADAKDGDVLHCWIDNDEFVLIYKGIRDGYITTYGHLYQKLKSFSEEPTSMFCRTIQGHFTPATKEQRNALIKVMADAGYTFDFENKKLKKIEQNISWSEEDDNCLSTIIAEFSKCAGKSVSKDEWMRCNDFLHSLRDRVKPKQEWSKEDDVMIRDILGWLPVKSRPEYNQRRVDWLKSLKDRVQPKQE